MSARTCHVFLERACDVVRVAEVEVFAQVHLVERSEQAGFTRIAGLVASQCRVQRARGTQGHDLRLIAVVDIVTAHETHDAPL